MTGQFPLRMKYEVAIEVIEIFYSNRNRNVNEECYVKWYPTMYVEQSAIHFNNDLEKHLHVFLEDLLIIHVRCPFLMMMMMMMKSAFAPLWGLQRQCFSCCNYPLLRLQQGANPAS